MTKQGLFVDSKESQVRLAIQKERLTIIEAAYDDSVFDYHTTNGLLATSSGNRLGF